MNVAVLVLLVGSVGGTECIRLSGPEDLVRSIERELSDLDECEPVAVEVSLDDGRLRLDSEGVVRVVSTPEVAATVLESWVERRLTESLVEGPPPGAPRIGPTEDAPPAEDRVAIRPEAVTDVAPAASRAPFGGAVRGEIGVDDGSVLTTGVFARADVRWGPAIAWVGGRLGFAPGAVPGDASDGRRTAAGLEVGVELPVALASWTIAPGAAVGARWSRTSRASQDTSSCVRERCALDGATIPDDFVYASVRPELEAQLRATWPLTTTTGLEGALVASYVVAPERTPSPEYAPTMPIAAALALPSEAQWALRLGIGLRWGEP